MLRRIALVASTLACTALPAACPPPEAADDGAAASGTLTPTSEDDKTLYAMGQVLSRGVSALALDEREVDLLLQGFRDSALGAEPQVDLAAYTGKLQAFAASRRELVAQREKEAAQAFVLEAAAAEGAEQTDSGLVFREISPGEGEAPQATDRVKVHYHGTLRDGKVFDSSRERGEPAVFPLNRVIKCWTEALQKMKPGGKADIVCPSDIAYGDRGSSAGGIPPGAALRFEVELLEVVKAPTPAQKAPPADAPAGAEPEDS